jgi:multidrug efflux pump subunit AcrB
LLGGVILALGLSSNNFSLFVMIGLILLLGMLGAMLPLALGQGAGHELNSPMA